MKLINVLGAMALGASAMYYLDPDQGRRRRALVADKADSIYHDTRDYLQSTSKRTSDRVRGLAAQVRRRMRAEPPSDQQLYGQLRSRLGRVVSYPHAIDTDVQEGRVLLRGDILESEYNMLMAEIWAMPGVIDIDSQLVLHAEPGNVPKLQGKPHRTRAAKMRLFTRQSLLALAIATGIRAALGAIRAGGLAQTGKLSLAVGLLAYGMGDNARHRGRQRRMRGVARRSMAAGVTEQAPRNLAEVSQTTAAGPAPATWQH